MFCLALLLTTAANYTIQQKPLSLTFWVRRQVTIPPPRHSSHTLDGRKTRITPWPLRWQNSREAAETRAESNAAKANTWQAAEDRGQGGREPGWRRTGTRRCQRSAAGAKAARRALHFPGSRGRHLGAGADTRPLPRPAPCARSRRPSRAASVRGRGWLRPPAAAPPARQAPGHRPGLAGGCEEATEVRPARAPPFVPRTHPAARRLLHLLLPPLGRGSGSGSARRRQQQRRPRERRRRRLRNAHARSTQAPPPSPCSAFQTAFPPPPPPCLFKGAVLQRVGTAEE